MRQTEEQKREQARLMAKYKPVRFKFEMKKERMPDTYSGPEIYALKYKHWKCTWYANSRDGAPYSGSIASPPYTTGYLGFHSSGITNEKVKDWAKHYAIRTHIPNIEYRLFYKMPMDGTLTRTSWTLLSADIRYTYTLGPKDCMWIEEYKKEELDRLTHRQAQLYGLDERTLRQLTNEYPAEAAAARAKYEPLRIRSLELKREQEANAAREKVESAQKAARDAEIQRQKAVEAATTQRQKAAEAAATQRRKEAEARNKSLHALFEPHTSVTTRNLQAILDQGAQINYQAEQDGYTVLMLAVDHQNDQIVEWLLNKGANPLIENKHKQKASNLASSHSPIYQTLKNYELLFAARSGNSEAARLACRTGANINFRDPADGYTVLMVAIKQRHSEVADYLLSLGADHTLPGDDGINAYELVTRTYGPINLVNPPVPRGTQPSLNSPFTVFGNNSPQPLVTSSPTSTTNGENTPAANAHDSRCFIL